MTTTERKILEGNRDTTLILIPIVAILGKFIQFYILPDKYFYDGTRMCMMINETEFQNAWSGYQTTVDIFKKINFFHFTTIEQWSIELGIIFTILFMIIVSKVKTMRLMESIYTLMAIGLLNIYVFNLAKEPIQMMYFAVILLIIMLPIDNNAIKIIGCAAVYYWEASTFRAYYIIMAVMSVALFVGFIWLSRRKMSLSKPYIILVVALCYVAVLLFFYASQYVDYDSYIEALNVRDTASNENASTAILNYVEVDGNFGKFVINYIINSVRMLVPIELLIKGIAYVPFVIYQFFILFYWIRTIKNIRTVNGNIIVALSCFTAYLFGSFVFEPDFGSWVRHESATFPVFYVMAYEDLGNREYNINEKGGNL